MSLAPHPSPLDYLRLTKPALTAMILFPTFIGFYLAAPHPLPLCLLARTMLGVALLAGGSAAANQYLERERDGRMARTAGRPLPAGRLAPAAALHFGAALALSGMALLAFTVNLPTAEMAAFSFALYVFVYTPMKRISPLATLVGAVSGALPPLLGWSAAGASLTPAALTLFGILYLWQIPHFLAIVWKYREQYRAAGFRLYGALDPTGRATALQALLYSLALLPVSLMLAWQGVAGLGYTVGAFALGLGLISYSLAFTLRPDAVRARRLFIATIVYLPLLLLCIFWSAVA